MPPESSFTALVDLFRRRIVSGEWRPGQALPPRTVLARSYRCSAATIQQAIQILSEDGFLSTAPRRRTAVAAQPPHRFRRIIAFDAGPTDPPTRWPRFFDRLLEISTKPEHALTPRFGIGDDPQSFPTAELIALARDRRCAGIVLTVMPHLQPRLMAALIETGIPLATIGPVPTDLPTVVFAEHRWWEAALAACAQRRLIRVAVLINSRDDEAWRSDLDGMVKRLGLFLPRHFCHEVPLGFTRPVRRLAELLARLPSDDRPEALLVLDDNLASPVLAGLDDAGIPPGGKPFLLIHGNFPIQDHLLRPCLRFGPDLDAAMQAAIRLLSGVSGPISVPLIIDAQ